MNLEPILGDFFPLDKESKGIAPQKTSKHRMGVWAFFTRAFAYIKVRWNEFFVRRELFIRQIHGTRRIVFEKNTQILLLFIALSLLFWLTYATSNVVLGKTSAHIIKERLANTHNLYEKHISKMQKDYDDLNLRVSLTEKEFAQIVKELTERHNHIATMIGMSERIGALIKKRNLEKEQKEDKDASDPPKINEGRLKPLRSQDEVFLTSRPSLQSFAFFPSKVIHNPNHKHYIKAFLLKTGHKPLDELTQHLTQLDRHQRAILDHLDENVSKQVEKYKQVFKTIGALNPDLFAERIAIAKANQNGEIDSSQNIAGQNIGGQNIGGQNIAEQNIGGPLIALGQRDIPKHVKPKKPAPLMTMPDRKLGKNSQILARQQINSINQKLHLLRQLDEAILYIPITKPMDDYYITSTFGPRIDPFTREWAFHTGLDIAGESKSPIKTTLPGVVTFAGNAGNYGKMVEVSHGFQIKTRYGHLGEILVKKGQRVEFAQHIGFMGNSGRSTGEHLHYEIMIDDKPYDPWKFMEASKYVFETSR